MLLEMTRAQFVLLVSGLWLSAGLGAMLWMARRGHRDPLWLLSAVVFGPILALIAPERVERTPRVLTAERFGDVVAGPRVLVGVDGSPESRAALQAVLDLRRGERSALVLAAVVDYDSAEVDWRGRQRAAQERLAAARSMVEGHDVTCEVLAGPPGRALLSCAERYEVGLVAVGRRGGGVSVRILGSVANELVRKASVPLLVAGSPTRVHPHCTTVAQDTGGVGETRVRG